MEQMPKQIADAILSIMGKVGYVQKKGENKFHGYKYASIEGVLEKVQPALVEGGLVITQSELEHTVIAESQLMEARYAFSLAHKEGATFGPIHHTGLASFRNTKGGYDDKALNKCHTAARKYFILGLFQIPTGLGADPDDDEDKPAANGTSTHHEATPTSTIAGRRNEAKGASEAREWVNAEALPTLAAMTLPSSLTVWLGTNTKMLTDLETAFPEQFKALDARINKTMDRLMSAGPA